MRVGRSGSVARVGRYSLSGNGKGAQQRAARHTGSEGQVWSFCQGESQLEGSKSRSGGPERESAGAAAAGASAGRISVDICISTQVNQKTRIRGDSYPQNQNRGYGRFVEESLLGRVLSRVGS